MSEFTDRDENVREQVKDIQSFAGQALKFIERHYIEKPSDGKPLIVLLGEDHFTPSHYLSQMEIARLLKEKGYKIAVGLEAPYNETENLFRCELREIPEISEQDKKTLVDSLSRRKPHGDPFHHTAAMYYRETAYALHASQVRMRYFMNEEIPLAFNDAPYNASNHEHLDKSDFHVQSELAKLSTKSERIMRSDPLGVYIRNKVMAELSKRHIASTKPDIYLMIQGNQHTVGDAAQNLERKNFLYRESSFGIHESQGDHVVAIAMASDSSQPRLSDRALNNSRVMKNRFLAGMTTNNRPDSDDLWIQKAMPQFWPDNQLHKDLLTFRVQCRALVDYVFATTVNRTELTGKKPVLNVRQLQIS